MQGWFLLKHFLLPASNSGVVDASTTIDGLSTAWLCLNSCIPVAIKHLDPWSLLKVNFQTKQSAVLWVQQGMFLVLGAAGHVPSKDSFRGPMSSVKSVSLRAVITSSALIVCLFALMQLSLAMAVR